MGTLEELWRAFFKRSGRSDAETKSLMEVLHRYNPGEDWHGQVNKSADGEM